MSLVVFYFCDLAGYTMGPFDLVTRSGIRVLQTSEDGILLLKSIRRKALLTLLRFIVRYVVCWGV